MAVFNGAFPVQAGKEEDARAFAAETFGARRPDFEAHLARGGITRETWALQETPMGSLIARVVRRRRGEGVRRPRH